MDLGGVVVIRGLAPEAGGADCCILPEDVRGEVCPITLIAESRNTKLVDKKIRIARFISIVRFSVDKCNNSKTGILAFVTVPRVILKEL